MINIRRALFSVTDKSGLVDLARSLKKFNVEFIASGGTAAALTSASLPVTPVEKWTGHPEAMEGRIKTLHPRIHGGILARRDHAGDLDDLKRLGLDTIDLVVVNFYPFEQVLASGKPEEDIIEAIDVGGPSMVRAACKNHKHVIVLTDPRQYAELINLLDQNNGSVPEDFAKAAAARAFTRLVDYDSRVAEWFNGGNVESLVLQRVRPLRYGENPHQHGWLLSRWGASPSGLVAADQLAGKELSYNNLLDAEGSLRLLAEFDEPAAVIIKHVTPCGVGIADTTPKALELALMTDRVSAFGGIVALNREMDEATAAVLADMFLEVILAPGFTSAARTVFAKKKALRLITFDWNELKHRPPLEEIRPIWGGYLAQEADFGLPELNEMTVATKRSPTSTEWAAMKLAWKVCKHVRSNAIVFADERHTLGIGAGQMSRVDSAQIAVQKAAAAKLELYGCACGSDAFFPFRDGLDVAARAGATAVIQPGGSVRDDEVIAAADEHGMTMVFTGRRHFRH
ncbi:bifunctional phosphoribosylaminoimidazolecarboxamide formyltransferase/IMP cyclohydrolase PurH [candidate division KSB1 bacterium]|nr:MAG: bifunctional phosphoribosylaminoimidazolecarboxamide formyltransferase/IMP cyclohydrolase PurH [candidate division KSB1 bacterium]